MDIGYVQEYRDMVNDKKTRARFLMEDLGF